MVLLNRTSSQATPHHAAQHLRIDNRAVIAEGDRDDLGVGDMVPKLRNILPDGFIKNLSFPLPYRPPPSP